MLSSMILLDALVNTHSGTPQRLCLEIVQSGLVWIRFVSSALHAFGMNFIAFVVFVIFVFASFVSFM
ncbi:hypothetical protein AADW59_00110 [Candidatus Hodgkinia cicadicola]